MKSMIRKILLSIIAVFCLLACRGGIGESFPTHFLLTGEIDSPVSFSIYAPEYTNLAQFGKERLDSLNRLLRHVSIVVNALNEETETIISIDQEPLISITDNTAKLTGKTEQTKIENQESDTDENEISIFLDERYFRLNNLLDGLYTAFSKAADSFPEMTGKSSATLNFSGFGKSVSRLTIQFPSEYVGEHFPDALAGLCNDETTRHYIGRMVFRGAQKIVLLFDQNEKLLRINYDGTVGFSEDELRRISLVWKCMRTSDRIKDSFSIKTPAVTGYDRDNISYDRELDLSDPGNQKLKWDYQLDRKKEKVKTKTRYTGDFVYTDTNLTGKIHYNTKGDNHSELSMILSAGLEKEKDAEYAGTLEITNKTGKIVTSSVHSGFSIGQSSYSERIKAEQNDNQICLKDMKIAENGDLPEKVISVLIRKMMTLPDEDTEFLRKDIPDEIWKLLTNH